MVRKSYIQVHGILLIALARGFHQNGKRPLRDVAVLLARAGFATQTGKPFGPAAVSKMIRSDITFTEQQTKECAAEWSSRRWRVLKRNENPNIFQQLSRKLVNEK